LTFFCIFFFSIPNLDEFFFNLGFTVKISKPTKKFENQGTLVMQEKEIPSFLCNFVKNHFLTNQSYVKRWSKLGIGPN